jgi:hypothetical protein
MKKSSSILVMCIGVVAAILSGCQKGLDLSDKEIATTPLPGQAVNCRIESMWVQTDFGDEFRLVLYDEYENPVVITTPGIGTGHPYITFKYDSWHRLRQYCGEYIGGSFEFLHVYGFDHNGRIGIDTGYVFGSPIDHPVHYLDRSISTIEYDNQNRIVKVVSDYERTHYHFESRYDYDVAGNLMYPDDPRVTYDNKMNLYRTSDIWMFLARDYSMNNPFVATAYNAAGFPTVMNNITPAYFNFLSLNIRLNNSQFSYNCKQAYW